MNLTWRFCRCRLRAQQKWTFQVNVFKGFRAWQTDRQTDTQTDV